MKGQILQVYSTEQVSQIITELLNALSLPVSILIATIFGTYFFFSYLAYRDIKKSPSLTEALDQYFKERGFVVISESEVEK